VLDLRRLREDPAAARAALGRRDPALGVALDGVLALDERRRALLPEVEGLRARKNEASQAIGEAKRSGGDATDAIAAVRDVGERQKAVEEELAQVEAALEPALAALPNLPDPQAAQGGDAVLREVGERPAIAAPRDHLELAGERIDMERAAKLSGARFAYLRGELVFLELALVRWALEVLRGHGFEPVIPPVLVREEALFGTGFLPDT